MRCDERKVVRPGGEAVTRRCRCNGAQVERCVGAAPIGRPDRDPHLSTGTESRCGCRRLVGHALRVANPSARCEAVRACISMHFLQLTHQRTKVTGRAPQAGVDTSGWRAETAAPEVPAAKRGRAGCSALVRSMRRLACLHSSRSTAVRRAGTGAHTRSRGKVMHSGHE
jgi:hypothetical protein